MGFHTIDALSDVGFCEKGLVDLFAPGTNCMEPFLERGMEGLWTYYCTGQWKEVSNRFMAMPSARTRILGVQLYLYKISGFLHWGFNFYNSQYSIKHINPYAVTDAGEAFPSGDALFGLSRRGRRTGGIYPSDADAAGDAGCACV